MIASSKLQSYLYHGVYNIYLSMENGMFDLVFSNFIIDVQRIKKP